MTFAVIISFICLIYVAYCQHTILKLESEKEKLKLQFNDEDEAMNWLEAASVVSDKAKLLLEDVNKCKQLPSPAVPKDNLVLMLEDIFNEPDEAVRLVKFRIINMEYDGFLNGERDKIINLFKNEYCRCCIAWLINDTMSMPELDKLTISEELSYIKEQMAKHSNSSVSKCVDGIEPRLVSGG